MAILELSAAAAGLLGPALTVPAEAAHDDGDAGDSHDHAYDRTRHQHRRHEHVVVVRALQRGVVGVAGAVVSVYQNEERGH